MTLHFKPTYNFQTVEFDVDMEKKEDLDGAFELYAELIKRLKEVAPEQPNNNNSKPQKPNEPLATEKQKAIMDKFNIAYKPNITKSEAFKLIAYSMGK